MGYIRVSKQGLLNRLESLQGRISDLYDYLEELEDEGEETISTYKLRKFLEDDDAFNLSIAIDVIDQVEDDEDER